jgi:hypothetical protein
VVRRRAPLRSLGRGTFSTSIPTCRFPCHEGLPWRADRHADHQPSVRRTARGRGSRWRARQRARQREAGDVLERLLAQIDKSYTKYAYNFRTAIAKGGEAGSLLIRCIFHGPTISINPLWFFPVPEIKETTEVVGAFDIGGCNGESVDAVIGTMPWPNPVVPLGTDVEALTYVLSPTMRD